MLEQAPVSGLAVACLGGILSQIRLGLLLLLSGETGKTVRLKEFDQRGVNRLVAGLAGNVAADDLAVHADAEQNLYIFSQAIGLVLFEKMPVSELL